MFKLNLKIALRNLWRNKGLSLINISGLGIGIACCIMLLLYVVYEWRYDKQFANADKSYIVYTNMKSEGEITSTDWTAVPMAADLKNNLPEVNYSAHFLYPRNMLISSNQTSFKKMGVYADPDFLKILNYKFLSGDNKNALQDPTSIILTKTLAKQLFGNEDPLNKSVKFNANKVLTVKGIIQDAPSNSTLQFDYLLPWSFLEAENSYFKNAGWEGISCSTIIQLKDNAHKEKVDAYVKNVFKKYNRGEVGEGFLHPLSKWHLYGEFKNGKAVGGKIDQLKLLFFLAICTLLIACANFMNLSTAQSEKRAKEVGVRKAMGSPKKMLLVQFFTESLLISVFASIFAFVLVELGLPYFNQLLNVQLSVDYNMWQFWVAFISISILTGFIAGSYPSFYLSSFEPVKVLKGIKMQGSSSISIRKILVVFQFTFTICLIVAVIIIFQQLNYIKNKPIGYNRNNLVQIPIQGKLREPGKLEVLQNELIKSGVAEQITATAYKFTGNYNGTLGISWPGKDPNASINFSWNGVSQNFSKALNIKLLGGRDFDPKFNDSANVIVNEAAVKMMGLKNPVGSKITWDDNPRTIVGVVQNFLFGSPYESSKPLVLFSARENDISTVLIRLNEKQNLSTSLNKIDQIVKALNPEYPVDRVFVDAEFDQKINDEVTLGALSNWFGGFAIFISGLGLLGLALFMAEQRKKEISIRKVLGAESINILALMNKDFIKLVLIANVIALPLSYIAVSKWLSGYEYRISISVIPFLIAGTLSVLIALLTVSIQSFKVIKSNPIDALKYE